MVDTGAIVQDSDRINVSHKKDIPWSSANSLWHSSYGFPLTHTSLRAYLPPEKEKNLLNDLPRATLERQYHNEAVKVSHIQGLIDSTRLQTFINQSRCSPRRPGAKPTIVDRVISNEPHSEVSPRRARQAVPGAHINKSGAQYDIFLPSPPSGTPDVQLDASSSSSSRPRPTELLPPFGVDDDESCGFATVRSRKTKQPEVSGKIGADHLRKPQRRWQVEICSKIGSQGASENRGDSCTSRLTSVAVTTPRTQRSAQSSLKATAQRLKTPAVRSPAQPPASAPASSERPVKEATLDAPRIALFTLPPGVTSSTDTGMALPTLPSTPGELSSIQEKPWLTKHPRKKDSGKGTASYVPLHSNHLAWARLRTENS